MRWQSGQRSDDIEDRRGFGGGGGGGGNGPRLGLGGLLVLVALSFVFGRDLVTPVVETQMSSGQYDEAQPGAPRQVDPGQDKLVDFVSFVLNDVQDFWTAELPRQGQHYEKAKLVLFTDTTRSGCGFAETAMGPFYCPMDHKVYIDLGFYNELRSRFGAPGDFAQAYVLAHEVGHHVQNLLGIASKVRDQQQQHPESANELSVRLELQADCFAGVWGHSTQSRNILEAGDVEEGLGAAAAVGDDRIQKASTGRVNPETWTHGSAKQRVTWFKRGFDNGRVADCNTFEDE